MKTMRATLRATAVSAALAVGILSAGAASAASDAERYVQSAEAHMENRDLRAAVIELKNALQAQPDHAPARILLGRVYLQVGDAAAAEKELSRAQALGAARSEWLLELAQAHLGMGQLREALALLEPRKGDQAGLAARILALRSRAQVSAGNLDAARSAFRQAEELDREPPEVALAEVFLAAGEGDTERARELARSLSTAHPDYADGWRTLGNLERTAGNLQAARDAYTKALDLQPGDLQSGLGRTAVLMSLNQLDEADRQLQRLRERAPGLVAVRYLSALMAMQRGDLDASKTQLQEILREANHLPSNLLLGSIHYQQNELESADVHLSTFLAAAPGHVPASKLLAAVRMKRNEPQRAIALLAPLEPNHPEDVQLLAILGTAYMQQRDFELGSALLERAAALAPDSAALRTQLGLGHLVTGRHMEAVDELNQAVDLGQDVVQADVLLILAHLQNKRSDEAVESARRLAERHPKDPMAHNLLSAALLAKGERDAARKHLNEALRADPAYHMARINLARMEMQDGDVDAARGHYRAVLERDPGHVRAALGLARLEQRQGDVDSALALVERAHEHNTNAVEPGLVLIRHYLNQGENLKAVGVARQLAERRPKDPRVLLQQGLAQMAAGQTASAINTLERLTREAQQSESYRHLAAAYLQNEQPERAREALQRAVELDESDISAWLARGSLELRQGESAAAREVAEAVQQRFPSSPAGFILEGDVARSAGDHTRAAQLYAQAYALEPNSAAAIRLAKSRMDGGDGEGAADALRRWLAEQPKDGAARLMLASQLQRQGDAAGAAEHYRQLLQDDPDNVVALNNLAWVSHALGDRQAREYAERAYELQPQKPEIADTLAWILLHTGDAQRALSLLKEASARAPHLGDVRYHLAVALEKTGDRAAAEAELRRLLKSQPEFASREEAEALLAKLSSDT